LPYIIHCNDNPEMAGDGLLAARKYAQIAPASAHATHMPSHIFAQLGLWDEMEQSNQVSLRAAEQDTNASPCEKVGNTLHAMSYLVLALAETGRVAEARTVLERAKRVRSSVSGADLCYDAAAEVLSGYVVETGEWDWAKQIRVEGNPGSNTTLLLWLAIGIAAARTGNDVRANEAEQNLVALRDARGKLPGGTPQNSMEVLRLAIAGWRAEQLGRNVEAVRDLREASDLQDRPGTSYVTIKPVREMLADLLLLDGDPGQALTEYKTVLAQKPNRFNSLNGAGSAAFAQGDVAVAKSYYSQLLAFAKGDERPELVTARIRMQENSSEITR
jgi:tetratricopeptide (TPR) repeat protein